MAAKRPLPIQANAVDPRLAEQHLKSRGCAVWGAFTTPGAFLVLKERWPAEVNP
jgi:hypothetical protein